MATKKKTRPTARKPAPRKRPGVALAPKKTSSHITKADLMAAIDGQNKRIDRLVEENASLRDLAGIGGINGGEPLAGREASLSACIAASALSLNRYAEDTKIPSPYTVNDVLDYQGKRLGELLSTVHLLTLRLYPVLRQEAALNGASAVTPSGDSPASEKLRHRVDQHNGTINTIDGELCSLLERLELP